jgi:hypothetical protein
MRKVLAYKQYQAVGINDDLELLMEVTEWWIKLHSFCCGVTNVLIILGFKFI